MQREDGGLAWDVFNDAVRVLLEKRYPAVGEALCNALTAVDALPPHEALLIVAYPGDLFAGTEMILLEERGWPGTT